LRVNQVRAKQKRQKRNAEMFAHERPNPSEDPLATAANLVTSLAYESLCNWDADTGRQVTRPTFRQRL
jgi:hypothetical protein